MLFLFLGQYNHNQPPISLREPTCPKSTLPSHHLGDCGGSFFQGKEVIYIRSFIRRILGFDFWGRKAQAERLVEVLVRLEEEGEIQIYETYDNGEWDFAIKKIDGKRGGEKDAKGEGKDRRGERNGKENGRS